MLTSRQSHTSAAKRDAGVALAAVLTDLPVPGTFGGVDRLLTRQRTCRKLAASGIAGHARGSQMKPACWMTRKHYPVHLLAKLLPFLLQL